MSNAAAEPTPIGQTPEKACDVIMKGGITSGVIYPRAIVELSRHYRFANVGGTSAGAIAAAVTAAAEYGRATGGFDRIAKVPAEMSRDLLKLFQPTPALKPLFDVFISTLGEKSIARKVGAAIWSGIIGYKTSALLGVLPGLAILTWAGVRGIAGWAAFGALLAVIGLLGAIVARLIYATLRELPQNNFGMCTGNTQPGYHDRAITEWLADTIDECAGLKREGAPGGKPLTFGELENPPDERPPIHLAMMTTNLSMKRPYRLPFSERTFGFRKSDVEALFPARVAKYLLDNAEPFAVKRKRNGVETEEIVEGYIRVPPAEKLPVVVAARMSLSFPGLFSAVPLYACDFTLMGERKYEPQLCLFSDGGLSSNFPIQFFDRLWPNSPTFGIALDAYEKDRDRTGSRIWMPGTAGSGALLPIETIDGLPAFLVRLIDAAKDWQDNLQSTQHGYRERIVHVALKPEEGGVNLTMPQSVIDALSTYGKQAGEKLVNSFNLDEHRWRRFLVAMARLEDLLGELAQSHESASSGLDSFQDFLRRYPARSETYKPKDDEWLAEILERAEALVALARRWHAEPRVNSGRIPKPATDLRITPKP